VTCHARLADTVWQDNIAVFVASRDQHGQDRYERRFEEANERPKVAK
jgi:hypothetical protein